MDASSGEVHTPFCAPDTLLGLGVKSLWRVREAELSDLRTALVICSVIQWIRAKEYWLYALAMSRSIHANRSHGQWQRTGTYDWDAIARKRGVKAGARRGRRMPDAPLPFTEAADVPIRFVDESRLWFFPVSADDVRAVLSLLPRGVATGLREIFIEPGRRAINGTVEPHRVDRIDPLGRAACVVTHDVLAPAILGVYQNAWQRIRLFGYVQLSRKPLTRRQQVDLELHALTTLVHEISHHHDRMYRMGDERSWNNYKAHAEEYAQRLETRWVLEAVVPYLQRKHGDEHGARLRKLTLTPPGRKRYLWPMSKAARKRQLHSAMASISSSKTRRWLFSSTSSLALERWHTALTRDDLPFGKRRSQPTRRSR
jgi:hypothetical protein